MINVFVDSSVFFSTCYSRNGASREIIAQGIARKLNLIISKHVIEEVERNLLKDAPKAVPIFKEFLNAVPFKIVHPTAKEVQKAASYVELKDASIVVGAKKAKADFLVSLDTKHLVLPHVAKQADIEILLPGEFLKRLRN